jgi:hypothetical protein
MSEMDNMISFRKIDPSYTSLPPRGLQTNAPSISDCRTDIGYRTFEVERQRKQRHGRADSGIHGSGAQDQHSESSTMRGGKIVEALSSEVLRVCSTGKAVGLRGAAVS